MSTHGKLIQLPDGASAFVDGIPDECEHDSKGDVVYQSASGKIIYWHTYRKWASLPTKERGRLIQEYHDEIEDPITMMTSTCSKCKKAAFNPYDLQ